MSDADALNASEIGMSDALAEEFRVISGTDDEYTILDYVAVARVLNPDGSVQFRATHRADSLLVDQLGLFEYGRELTRARLHHFWASS